MSTERPAIEVAVTLRRERILGAMSRWQEWRWLLDDVILHEAGFGTSPRLLYRDENGERWLHPGLRVELFSDDAEGYQLNLTTPNPCWFVLWRMEDEAVLADAPIAVPVVVRLPAGMTGMENRVVSGNRLRTMRLLKQPPGSGCLSMI